MSPCPQCGAALRPGAPFCGSCGHAVAPASTPDPGATQVRPAVPPVDPSNAQTAHAPQQPQGQQPPPPPAQGQQWGQQQPGQQPGQTPQQQWGQQPGQAPQQQWGRQPGQAPQQQWAQPGAPGGFDVNKILGSILGGNWIGMAMVAGAALGVALVLGLLIGFTGAEDLNVASALSLGIMLMGTAFGPDLRLDMGDDIGGSLGQYPTLATLLALGVAVFLFRRFTAGHRDIKQGLGDAARVGVIVSAVLTVVAIIFTAVKPDLEGYTGSGLGSGAFNLGMPGGETGLSIAGAIFVPFFLVFTVLALSCVVRGDWMQGKLAQVHAWIAAPLWGVAALVVATLVAGLIFVICMIIGEDSAREFNTIMRMVAILPSLGLFMISLGSLSELGEKQKADGDSEKSFDRLGDFADSHGAIFWIAPVVAIAAAAVFAYTVIWKSTDRTKVQRNVLVSFGVLVVTLPFLIRIANAHAHQWRDDDDYYLTAGVDGFQTVLLFVLLTAIVSAVMLVVTGNLDVNAVKAKAQNAANQAQQQYRQQQAQNQWQQQQQGQAPQQQWGQQQPGQAPQQQWGQQPPQQPGQPPQQQWGQQPPAQQPPQQPGQQQPGQQQWGQQPPQQPGQPGQPPQQPGEWGQPPQQ